MRNGKSAIWYKRLLHGAHTHSHTHIPSNLKISTIHMDYLMYFCAWNCSKIVLHMYHSLHWAVFNLQKINLIWLLEFLFFSFVNQQKRRTYTITHFICVCVCLCNWNIRNTMTSPHFWCGRWMIFDFGTFVNIAGKNVAKKNIHSSLKPPQNTRMEYKCCVDWSWFPLANWNASISLHAITSEHKKFRLHVVFVLFSTGIHSIFFFVICCYCCFFWHSMENLLP